MLYLTRETTEEFENGIGQELPPEIVEYADKTIARALLYVLGSLTEGNFERLTEFNRVLSEMSEQAILELRIKSGEGF